MATKLKKMRLTSVDLVRAGANQKADICLYKSANPPNYNCQTRKEGNSMIKIDKSLFSAEELEMYNALIEKAMVDPEVGEEEMEKEKPPVAPKRRAIYRDDEEDFDFEDDLDKGCGTRTRKSIAAEDDVFKTAIERQEARIAELEKSLAMKEFSEIAKKYAALGENEEELAKTLYDMYQASEETYNKYINTLNKSLELVEKSGLFSEIGKSAGMNGSADVLGRVEEIAKSYMKSDSSLNRYQALAKAWGDNPELIAEYDREYRA